MAAEQAEGIVSLKPPSLAAPSHERPVERWLETVPERKRSAVLQYAASERSFVLSYLYASMLGLEVGIDDWETFVLRNWMKLDTRAMLQTEIVNLHQDISDIRGAVQEGVIRRGDAPTKISYLSRELRSHIETLSKDISCNDRRALIQAGIEVCSKNLRKVLGRNAAVWPAIEAVLEACWADVEARHAL